MPVLVLLVVAVAACGLPVSAAAKPNPVVPPFVQNLMRSKAQALAYVPTRVPFAYRYVRYRWDSSRRVLSTTLADRRFAVDGRRSVAFTASRYRGTLQACANGREKTLQMGGNKVYWDGEQAWRCLRGVDGRLVRVAATGPRLPAVALGRVVASAKRVS